MLDKILRKQDRILLNNKGQESIVFEVLIAVVLMTFVFLVGGYAMKSLNQTKCAKEIDLSMAQLASAIEKAGAISIGSYSYKFSPASCFGSEKTAYTLESGSSVLCSSYCPGSSTCYLLKYDNPKDPVSPVRYKCVNISRYVKFSTYECDAGVPPGYKKLEEPLVFPPGNYIFQSLSLNKPTICIYYKS